MWIDISDTETLGISPTKDTFTQKLVLEITEFKIFIPYKETTVKNTVTSNITHTYSKRKWLAFWSYHKIELSNHLFLCFFAVIRSQSDQMSSYITCLHVGSQQITSTWTGRHSQCVNSDLTVRRCTISHICSAVNDKIIKTTNDLS